MYVYTHANRHTHTEIHGSNKQVKQVYTSAQKVW